MIPIDIQTKVKVKVHASRLKVAKVKVLVHSTNARWDTRTNIFLPGHLSWLTKYDYIFFQYGILRFWYLCTVKNSHDYIINFGAFDSTDRKSHAYI